MEIQMTSPKMSVESRVFSMALYAGLKSYSEAQLARQESYSKAQLVEPETRSEIQLAWQKKTTLNGAELQSQNATLKLHL